MKYQVLPYLVFLLPSLLFSKPFEKGKKLNSSYIIQLAVLQKTPYNSDNFKNIFKYGEVYTNSYNNGIVKVFLRPFEGYFSTREEANRVLRKVKKYKKFRKAFIKKIPNIPLEYPTEYQNDDSEREIIIKVKLSELKKENTNNKKTKKHINQPKKQAVYKIYLGCFKNEKEIGYIKKEFGLDKKAMKKLKKEKKGNCTSYYIGTYLNINEVEKILKLIYKTGKMDVDVFKVENGVQTKVDVGVDNA